jgi:hypothetical protein
LDRGVIGDEDDDDDDAEEERVNTATSNVGKLTTSSNLGQVNIH